MYLNMPHNGYSRLAQAYRSAWALQQCRFAPLFKTNIRNEKKGRGADVDIRVTLHVHACSSCNHIICLMRRPYTDSAPNKPVTLLRNQLWYIRGHESHAHCHSLTRYPLCHWGSTVLFICIRGRRVVTDFFTYLTWNLTKSESALLWE